MCGQAQFCVAATRSSTACVQGEATAGEAPPAACLVGEHADGVQHVLPLPLQLCVEILHLLLHLLVPAPQLLQLLALGLRLLLQAAVRALARQLRLLQLCQLLLRLARLRLPGSPNTTSAASASPPAHLQGPACKHTWGGGIIHAPLLQLTPLFLNLLSRLLYNLLQPARFGLALQQPRAPQVSLPVQAPLPPSPLMQWIPCVPCSKLRRVYNQESE